MADDELHDLIKVQVWVWLVVADSKVLRETIVADHLVQELDRQNVVIHFVVVAIPWSQNYSIVTISIIYGTPKRRSTSRYSKIIVLLIIFSCLRTCVNVSVRVSMSVSEHKPINSSRPLSRTLALARSRTFEANQN